MSEAILKVNGRDFGGFKRVRASRAIDQACGAFDLEITERYPGQPARWPINADDECQLILDDQVAITGFVDRVNRSFDASRTSVRVAGRDAAQDLVDCSAFKPGTEFDTGELAGMKLDQLARTIAQPYGVHVDVADGLDLGQKFSKPSIETGETCWEAIERYARQRGLLVMSDGRGRLVITKAGMNRNPNALIEGENILSADYTNDHSKRFAGYVALGQGESADNWSVDKAAHAKADTLDPFGRAPRLLIIRAEDLADDVSLRDRCRFERDVRRARAENISINVAGFSAGGRLWVPNERVPVRIPRWDIERELLIQSVDYSQAERSGSTTDLTLVPPEVYERLPEAQDSLP